MDKLKNAVGDAGTFLSRAVQVIKGLTDLHQLVRVKQLTHSVQ